MYFHADQVGTSRALSDGGTAIASPAAPVARRVYSAFGEPVFESAGEDYAQTRYGYVGGHGYEEGLLGPWGGQFNTYGDPDEEGTAPRLNYMHVGARWYDPSTGRFLQRDPIGIIGGLNVYAYVDQDPNSRIDPDGDRPRLLARPITAPPIGGGYNPLNSIPVTTALDPRVWFNLAHKVRKHPATPVVVRRAKITGMGACYGAMWGLIRGGIPGMLGGAAWGAIHANWLETTRIALEHARTGELVLVPDR